LRSAPSTTGSIRSIPSTRSSRFSVPGPVVEGSAQLSVVTELAEAVAQLRGQRFVDGEPVLGRRDPEELAVQSVPPPQFDDRELVIVDAQIDENVRKVRVAGVLLHDQKRGRLLAAPVAAGGLRSGEALDQALRE
jgi:hypothetical protein